MWITVISQVRVSHRRLCFHALQPWKLCQRNAHPGHQDRKEEEREEKSVWVHKRNLDVIMCRVPEFHIGGYINTERSDWVSSLTGCAGRDVLSWCLMSGDSTERQYFKTDIKHETHKLCVKRVLFSQILWYLIRVCVTTPHESKAQTAFFPPHVSAQCHGQQIFLISAVLSTAAVQTFCLWGTANQRTAGLK